MRFSAFIILFILFLASSMPANSQGISFSGKNVSLQQIFSTIKKQTGISFFYDAALVRDAKAVTVVWKNVRLETALNEIFKDQPLTWILEEKTVTIIKKPSPGTDAKPPLLSQIRVKGIVFDEEGVPIKDATIMIKNTNKGTVSDSSGKFSLMAERNSVLNVLALNHSPKEVKVEKGEMNITLQLNIKSMEAIIVGGNLSPVKRKAEANSITVLDAKTLEKIPENTLDQVFRGWVPGANSFDAGNEPEGIPNVSIRGSVGVSTNPPIAVYLDGIEYAGGSGYLFQLDKNNIDRIEIVKGPGAATLFGTGSNGGIIQIFTKKAIPGQTSVSFTTSAGFYKSKWVSNNPFQQMHSIETRTSIKNVAITMGGSYRTVGAYLPEGGEKNRGFWGGIRWNTGRLEANITTRYNVRNFHYSRDPYFDTCIHPRNDIIIQVLPGVSGSAYQLLGVMPSVLQNKDGITETYISGLNLSHKTTKNWTNTIDAGFSKNNVTQVPAELTAVPQVFASSKQNIITIRYSNVLSYINWNNGLAVDITSGAEYKRYSTLQNDLITSTATIASVKDPDNKNYGAFVQANASFKNVYLTMGVRYENNEIFTKAWNPRVGLTTNFKTSSFIIKPRISWGKGISPPAYRHRFGDYSSPNLFIVYPNADIKPQSQQGFDYGLEVYDKKGKFNFQVVYYDNILKDGFGQVSLGKISPDTVDGYMWTNIGKLANRGWEFSGEYKAGNFSLQGSFSIMNSILQDTVATLGLGHWAVPGARMPGLPRYTAGLNLNYHFKKLIGKGDKGTICLSITETGGLQNTDSKKYAMDVAYGRIPYDPDAPYPAEIDPALRVGLCADYFVATDLNFFIQASNILNDYTYEYSSRFITHGATWLFGIKYNFSTSKPIN